MQHIHKGHRERLRQRLAAEGLEAFQPHEVMELLLSFVIPYKDVNPLAHRLIDRFGSLQNVLKADPLLLSEETLISPKVAESIHKLGEWMDMYEHLPEQAPVVMDSWKTAGQYAVQLMRGLKLNCACLVCLSISGSLLHRTPLTTAQEMSPRQVVEIALRHKSYSLLYISGHARGGATPSPEDLNKTRQLVRVLEAVELQLMDFIVACGTEYTSLRKTRLLQPGVSQSLREPNPLFDRWIDD